MLLTLALDGAQLDIPAAVPPWIVSPLLIEYEACWILVLSGVLENYVVSSTNRNRIRRSSSL